MKSKLKILCWCCTVLLLWNCSDDDNPTSFYEEVNWFEIKDNPNDALDHLIYLVYKETGIPIFYNDTIGSETKGPDAEGNSIVRYEILNLTSDKRDIKYDLPKSRNNVRLGVEVLRKVIKEMPRDFYIHSFLLTESLRKDEGNPWIQPVYLNIYRGLSTVAIGKMDEIGEMSLAEIDKFTDDIVIDLLCAYIEESGFVDFYAVSNKFSPDAPWGGDL